MPSEKRDALPYTAERLFYTGDFLATADGHPFNGETNSWG